MAFLGAVQQLQCKRCDVSPKVAYSRGFRVLNGEEEGKSRKKLGWGGELAMHHFLTLQNQSLSPSALPLFSELQGAVFRK